MGILGSPGPGRISVNGITCLYIFRYDRTRTNGRIVTNLDTTDNCGISSDSHITPYVGVIQLRGGWVFVIRETYVWTNENVISKGNSFWDKGECLNLAVVTNLNIVSNPNWGVNRTLLPNLTL